MVVNENIILKSLKDSQKQTESILNVPTGYIEVSLSTKGKLGAPEIVHVRNFKVSEILALSLTSNRDLPLKLGTILNKMILEDTDVLEWHEKEVEELMLHIFMTFYKATLEDIPFPLNEEDLELISSEEDGEEKIEALKTGKWVPKTTINIAQSVDTYDIEEDFSPNITLTSKKSGFHVTFGFIKYGDQITIRNWIDSLYSETEKKFEKLKKALEYNKGISNQLKDNPDKINSLIPIDSKLQQEYEEYLIERTSIITEVANIISILDFNGEDVSKLSISEKYDKLGKDARIDYNLINKLASRQKKLHFGIKPEVSMISPFTKEVVKRPVSFRIPTIIQAMQLSGSDEYDDCNYDEN